MIKYLYKVLETREKEYIAEMLYRYKWDKRKTAQALGISVSSLYRKIKELEIKK